MHSYNNGVTQDPSTAMESCKLSRVTGKDAVFMRNSATWPGIVQWLMIHADNQGIGAHARRQTP